MPEQFFIGAYSSDPIGDYIAARAMTANLWYCSFLFASFGRIFRKDKSFLYYSSEDMAAFGGRNKIAEAEGLKAMQCVEVRL